ncbi:DNA translocase FtsK [Candidatus Uhrbacteria bacterium]|nr:DNA translocase FtsK [Candidatus Uhrbacteria bacterium]
MSRRKKSLDLSLHPKTRRGIGIVLVFALAALLLLALFNLSGAFGQALDDGAAYVFGWDRIALPFILIAWGMYLVNPERLPLRFTNVIGFFLFFLTLNPFVHAVTFPNTTNTIINDAVLRAAGGKLGETVALPLIHFLGLPGAIIVSIALLIIALLLSFNATLEQVLFAFRWLWKLLVLILRGLSYPFRKWLELRSQKLQEIALTPLEETAQETEKESSDTPLFPVSQSKHMADDEEDAPLPKPKRRYPRIEIPLELLERRDQRPTSGDINHNKEVIRRTLETFGIPVEMTEVSVGPTVTQFALKPSDGIKLTRITGLHNDLALALAAHPIRIEAPIPGKSLVGIEVPNQSVATVGLREILESKEFRERKTNLTFALGKDVAGKPWVADLTRMPHLLVAGATGSGKSVCLNTIIMSYLYTNGPDDLKLIMVDPKRVELQIYNGIPHLITPVITKVNETVNALKWALREMDRRYDLLAKFSSRDLATYNARVQDHLPYIVILIDELADLMATAASDVEGPIVRLAQMSRAVGIHLVLATQRPSVDVITGLIKANIPARIAFAVASATDSRTILDQQGAEKLLGRGDMLFSTAELATPKRVQDSFVSEAEIGRVVEFIKSKYEPADYDLSVTERPSSATIMNSGGDYTDDDSDALIPEAKEEILRAGKASASLLQRRLKVGYARAARLLDLLEEEGFIGPGDGAKPREILKADFTKQMAPPEMPRQQVAELEKLVEEQAADDQADET